VIVIILCCRMGVYDQFCNKEHAVLFATDIAARSVFFAIN
jgi:hypothetical protein